ncbi:MAG: glycogen/starch/alpha-glucan phosphorylase [Polyangiaceae bacterium]
MSGTTDTNTTVLIEDDRTGTNLKTMRRALLDHLTFSLGSSLPHSSTHDRYLSTALVTRDRIMRRWLYTIDTYRDQDVKHAYYLSAEFLLGRTLHSNLLNLGLLDSMREVAGQLGISLEDVLEAEQDAGLGNGGLGRLAACFLDSMATLGIAGMGYGIRYEYGIFEQAIRNGNQVEKPDEWLRFGNPWELERPNLTVSVKFGGRTQKFTDREGRLRVQWVDTQEVLGVPYDTPVVGYGRSNVNTLRLWSARASEDFDLEVFNAGDYEKAVYDKTRSETISKVLYPNDSVQVGRELRLKQQYFFVACAIADIIRRHLRKHPDLTTLADKAAIQLNDTHPSVAIPELMRVLIDDHQMGWDMAWAITQRVFAYTNHTLMAEALERWSVQLFERLLPRHLEIVYEINHRFLRQVQILHPNDGERLRRMSLIEEGESKNIRMAHLAVVGSHSVNGVAALHTQLLKSDVLRDFAQMYPEKFNNKTNGVTPRRWLQQCNPRLSSLITDKIGEGWVTDLDQLKGLESYANDAAFRAAVRDAKQANKADFARWLLHTEKIGIDPTSIFDVQVKRMHEYKRQLLNVLACIALYLRARQDPSTLKFPRTYLFGGKAAPGYVVAKQIIRLIHGVSEVINQDPRVDGLTVHFIPNYRVSLAEKLMPAADVSEQISTAGKEASGTGNMKFSMNGALTIGTLDGANIEIRDAVGHDAFFLFGLTAEEVAKTKNEGYRPWEHVAADPELREVLELVRSGFFSPENRELFHPLVDNLYKIDQYMLLADFRSYMETREKVVETYLDQEQWSTLAVRNIAAMGPFSSDRTIREYARDIWQTPSVDVIVPDYQSDAGPESLRRNV